MNNVTTQIDVKLAKIPYSIKILIVIFSICLE